ESELANFKIPQYAGRNIDKAIVEKSMVLFYARKKIHENRIQIQLKEIIGKKQKLNEIQERLKKNKEFLHRSQNPFRNQRLDSHPGQRRYPCVDLRL
ncbi:MAG: hypothetical protein QGG48_05090, partial [Desulfatiglandales bacterium]|nr:hypothetical protein [Desulfatiglandales bacterium]